MTPAGISANGPPVLFGVSGKPGSGKDSWAPTIAELLGAGEVELVSFGEGLKDECNDIVKLIRRVKEAKLTQRRGIEALAEHPRISPDVAAYYLRLFAGVQHSELEIWDCHQRANLPRSRDRAILRQLLQYHGTDNVRQRYDEDFWVRLLEQRVAALLAQGRSVGVTDVRQWNEAETIRGLGGVLVRLSIDLETQLARLEQRDGVRPDPATLNHPVEQDLDTYPFDVVVDNSGPPEATLAQLRAAMAA